ncbi:MAG: Na+/H+ antiporter NhaC [Thermovirgaceae bacterium]|jgi:NhaC family Na+:H+ antiporter|nr:Na+/H+ antiporter NhaC [Synergistales bacterium]MDI9393319.1 Na+/H+ antiporter NhaC [Synergistota bacterium]MDD3133042.1 Na+/H+ antiporter NhaC [Synergistales bacterium]MDD4022741.1 Na+/H+ antiporter NhaC [Synergistales bacterium]MDD5514370.1 Na+/H+ antiporter NhaC [Synergistales bacterium]
MVERTQVKPGLGLSLAVFAAAAVMISYGVLKLGVDAHVPIVFSAVLVCIVGLTVLKMPWSQIEEGALNAIAVALQAVVILMIIGMVIGIWLQSGVVPSLIYYGLSILSPSIFLLATLLITSIVSLSTGSSWTTAGTVGIALMGIAHGLGIPAPLTAGVVISGAYFGDKMSPLSDTTNLAPAVAGSNLFDHIRAMVWSTGPTYLIVAVICIVIGMKYAGGTLDAEKISAMQQMMKAEFNIGLLGFLPPLLVIGLAVMKAPAIPGLFAGVLVAAVMSAVQGNGLGDIINAIHYGYEATFASEVAGAEGEALLNMLSQADLSIAPEMATEVGGLLTDLLTRGGLDSMMWSISLVFCALFFGGAMEACGFLETIVGSITRQVKTVGGMMGAVIGSCFVANLFLGDQYLSLVIPGRMFKSSFEEKGLAPRMLSRALEDSGTLTSALIPWNTCGAFQSSVLGVATLAYAPYAFLNYLNPIVSLVMSYLKIGIYWRQEDGTDVVAKKKP